MTVFSSFTDITVYFAHSLGTPIFFEDGKKLGTLCDFFVDYEEVYPSVIALQYKRNNQLFYIAWEDVNNFSYKKVLIKKDSFIGRSRTYPKAIDKKVLTSLLSSQFTGSTMEYPALGKVVLDKQIVDTSGKKVVRVNDIQFIKSGKLLRVTHAAIGVRSMMRRLGFEKPIDKVVNLVRPKSKYLTSEILINWKYVHAIPNRSIQTNVKLNLSNDDIKKLHPADLADILEDLDNYGRELIFSNLDPKKAAETLSEVEQDVQKTLIRNDDVEHAAKIIENMDTDDAADILSELSEDRAGAIISNIEDDEVQEEIQELLEYDDNTAGGLMSTDVFEISPNSKKSEVLEFIKEQQEEFETVYDIYIVNEAQQLMGVCTLQSLLTHDDDVKVGEIMNDDDVKVLSPDTHWKEVARFMSKYNLITVPILDDKEELLGIVSVDDVLPWLLNER